MSQFLKTFLIVALLLTATTSLAQRRTPVELPTDGTLETADQPRLGDGAAPLEIVVFEDYKCPHCRDFSQDVLPELMADYIDSGSAKLIMLNFPLPLGEDSVTAALASECVYAQDKDAYWTYHEALFTAQEDPSSTWATVERLSDIAADIPEVDSEELASCIEDETYLDLVEAERAMGAAAGVRGTPSVFINGAPAPADLDGLMSSLDEALND